MAEMKAFVEMRCRAIWGEPWRELLQHYRGRNMYARQLLVSEFTSEAEVVEKIDKLVRWINDPQRIRNDLGGVHGS